MMNDEDLLNICNSPKDIDFDPDIKDFIYPREATSVRCRLKIINSKTIELTPGDEIDYGLRFNWGEKEYLRDFLILLKAKEKVILNDRSKFIEKQNSIPRLQDDIKLIYQMYGEMESTKGFFYRGYSSIMVFAIFRAVINKHYKDRHLFQKGLLRAINMSFHTFQKWRMWTDKDRGYYELPKIVKGIAEEVRDTSTSLIYDWILNTYNEDFAEEVFSRALGRNWTEILTRQCAFSRFTKRGN